MPPPPPPKPGVIPLAPLSLGDVIGGSMSTVGRYWKQLFGIAVLMYGGALLVTLAAVLVAYSATSDTLSKVVDIDEYDESFGSDVAAPLIVAFALVCVVAVLAMVVASAAIMAACPAVLQDAILGRRTTLGTVWRRSWGRVPAVIGAMLLPWLVAALVMGVFLGSYVLLIVSFTSDDVPGAWVALGFVLMLACFPVAVWVWVTFSLAPAAVVFESQRPVAALRRSARLVKGSWWRIFGISALAWLIATVAGYIVQFPLTIIGMLTSMPGMAGAGADPSAGEALTAMAGYLLFIMLGSIISQIIATTYPQVVTGLLYVDQRIRRENLAPALAEAAGAPH
ncbi:hypothetical protein AR457_26340 [Streptomyces agglomeratus]|uniref:DUF7847 domain-containing protein n=1 Tax=Streptomyces agglomeratus TaxID=285458 RepID=A0A1E5PD55_9ACTN|nr:hypothetical protein [Streptomyces agglomeratus]OEJ27457.1 hypothetical protein AS594_26215 [Streptomyces agglomeratus]OEJ38485.1 hypothetical protein BGK70_10315 [Streptomyces agglomeratus]OEJ47129.1 hypothetical protein AR457_26340 [Streptomyces agglomeratus]OEJ51014.1 hypothetical protein BGK72_09800 [Streptomyces agglomeratus]OEJ58384.1 hypothetical protein BGM19_10710 [Streptomyces agglomeratus]